MGRVRAIEQLVDDFVARRPIRSTSLIVTLFGDVVSQHGGVIWLGSLVECLGQLGIDERLVRTSTFRLVREGWLSSDRVGRRSFYSFTGYGRREYERAARRIYSPHAPPWDGSWTLLLPLAVPDDARDPFRKSMRWQGFGNLSPNVFAHPGSERGSLDEALAELGLDDKVVVMQASTDAAQSERLIKEVLWQNWNLAELAERYRGFIARFRPVLRAVKRAGQLAPEQCFRTRVLLIHEYRRILLHDTDVPEALLPADWPGSAARLLSAELYGLVAQGSVEYIESTLESENALVPGAAAAFWQRFN